ncbi:hypothetical protein J583_3271 [Acinetobacter baumannii 83444]|nr:hypothetical protein J583_3271 [Acinetobacter baumannii 83444]
MSTPDIVMALSSIRIFFLDCPKAAGTIQSLRNYQNQSNWIKIKKIRNTYISKV